MWPWLLSFGLLGIPPHPGNGLPAAPFDIEIGRQAVHLRQPLIARTRGARLVLYIRDRSELGESTTTRDFMAAVPLGSVVASLSDETGEKLILSHSGYSFYRGYMGLVLTETSPGARNHRYRSLEVESRVSLKGVRLVWLDRQGLRVEDLAPSL